MHLPERRVRFVQPGQDDQLLTFLIRRDAAWTRGTTSIVASALPRPPGAAHLPGR